MRQFGWFFTAATMLLCTLILRKADLRLHDYDTVGGGTVLSVSRTSSSENDEPIFEVAIEFTPAGGARRTLRSYTADPPGQGTQVEVVYQAANPDEARMRDGRAAPFGKWTLVLLLMPAVGLFFALFRTRQSLEHLRLLRTGRQSTATFVSATKEVSEDGESETEVRLAFVDENGREQILKHSTFSPARLQDDPQEIIFYDVEDPRRAVALDFLPGELELEGDRFVARWPLWPSWILPMVTIAEAIALVRAFLF